MPAKQHKFGKLGRLPKKEDSRNLMFARYLAPDLPTILPAVDWSRKMSRIGPMLNNVYGICAYAAIGHARQGWTANNGNQIIPSDDVVLQSFEDGTGFNPGDLSTDRGAVMLDVLKDSRKKDVCGGRLDAFAEIRPEDVAHIKLSIQLFGGAYLGLDLPESCQNQDSWHVTPGGTDGDPTRNSLGGHAVWAIGFSGDKLLVISWGLIIPMTLNFWRAYGAESYACFSREWADEDGAPSGFDYATLEDDVGKIAA